MRKAIVAEGLVKRFGSTVALDELSLTVREGTVMSLLGPNGAGKTTAVRVLTTLLDADAGTASVAGLDVFSQGRELKKVIGVSGQYAAVDENLTGFENLDMVGRLYHLGRQRSRQRARELLDLFDLTDAADRVVKGYSGGMRRRLDLAGALVTNPKVLFLDEPTTGLDPRSRLGMWDIISEMVTAGSTLLLTTQYLEEADRLADEIAVIDHGRVIARGTADELKSQVGGQRLEVTVSNVGELPKARAALEQMAVGEIAVDEQAHRLMIPVENVNGLLMEAVRWLDRDSIDVQDIGLGRPTLDDVFFTLTGHASEEKTDEKDGSETAGREADETVEGSTK